MKVSLEIADLAGKEFDTLKAYQSAVSTKNTDLEQLAREFRDLTNQRQAAYSRYLELAGQKNLRGEYNQPYQKPGVRLIIFTPI